MRMYVEVSLRHFISSCVKVIPKKWCSRFFRNQSKLGLDYFEPFAFDIDFVLHYPAGAATAWALAAAPGQSVEIAFTPAKLTPDHNLGSYLLIGDATAVPAIISLINYLPVTSNITVLLQDEHPDAAQLPIPHRANVTVSLIAKPSELTAEVSKLKLDPDNSYVWVAGERKIVAAIREIVRKNWRIVKSNQHTQYYWIEGKPFG